MTIPKSATIIAGLLAHGFTERECASAKYRQFELLSDPTAPFLFVGKAGALRRGTVVSLSYSLERTRMYNTYLERGRAELAKPKP